MTRRDPQAPLVLSSLGATDSHRDTRHRLHHTDFIDDMMGFWSLFTVREHNSTPLVDTHEDKLIYLNAPAVKFTRADRRMPIQQPVKIISNT